MSEQIMGTYEGEGSLVSGAAAVAPIPDVVAASTTATANAQGRTSAISIDRRRRLRVSSESARSAQIIDYSGADQVLANAARGFYITTAGTLVLKLAEDSASQTYTGLLAGQWYPFAVAVIVKSGSSAAGIVLF